MNRPNVFFISESNVSSIRAALLWMLLLVNHVDISYSYNKRKTIEQTTVQNHFYIEKYCEDKQKRKATSFEKKLYHTKYLR